MAETTLSSFKYYHYNPSAAAAIIFVLLFLVSTFVHLWQMIRKKTWYFVPFIIGGFCKCRQELAINFSSWLTQTLVEWIGYCGRAVSAHESPDWTLPPYMVQSMLLLLGPSFFAASVYMILGRIIRLTDGESHSMLRSRWLTKIFVTGDVFSFMVLSGGTLNALDAVTVSLCRELNREAFGLRLLLP